MPSKATKSLAVQHDGHGRGEPSCPALSSHDFACRCLAIPTHLNQGDAHQGCALNRREPSANSCGPCGPLRRPCRERRSKTPTQADQRGRRQNSRADGLTRPPRARRAAGGSPAAHAGPTNCPGGSGRGAVSRRGPDPRDRPPSASAVRSCSSSSAPSAWRTGCIQPHGSSYGSSSSSATAARRQAKAVS